MSYYPEIPFGIRKQQSPIAIPKNTDIHGTHYSHWGIGGYLELPDINYRNSIPTSLSISTDGVTSGRRKLGMIVYLIAENKYYQLIPQDGGELVSWEKWNYFRPAKKITLLNPELEFVDDFDDGTIPDSEGNFDWATYDTISGSGDPNDCWIEVFVKPSFANLSDLNNYLANDRSAYPGQICSVLDIKKVYLVISDTNGALTLQEIGGGSSSSEVFLDDIVVSIEAGKSFGKYQNGDTIPALGKTAGEVIHMACLEAISPDLSLSTSSIVQFGSANVSIVLNFDYTIKSLGSSISQLKIERKRAGDSAWSTILDNKDASSPFADNFSQTQYDVSLINYKYTVTDSMGGTNTITYNVTPIAYSAPSISLINLGNETRYRGDSATNYSATITRNSPLIEITSYKLQRSINSGSWTDVGSSVAVAGNQAFVYVNLTETQPLESSLKNANNIKYRINVTDSYTSTNLTEKTISFYHKCGIIYKSSALALSDIDSASGLILQNTKGRTINGVTASGGNYTYYVYDSSAGNLTNIIQNDSLPVLGAFSKQTDVAGENALGSSVTYSVYRSNSTNAFTNSKLIFS